MNSVNAMSPPGLMAKVLQELASEAASVANDCGLNYGDTHHVQEVARAAYRDGADYDNAIEAAQYEAERMSGINRKAADPMNSALALAGVAGVAVIGLRAAGWIV